MRIIARKHLIDFWSKYPEAEQALKAWFDDVSSWTWSNHAELKSRYQSISIINKKRVIFNIKGNKFRLIADIEYKLKIVFIVWVGTHKEYDKINVNEVRYDKANKK